MAEHLHARPRKSVRPGRQQRGMNYLASGLLLGSGALWLVAHYLLPLPEFAARHPLEPWAMRVHGAAVLLAMLVLGSLWTPHLQAAWKQRRHLGTGLVLGSSWLALALSGYGLYYVADEDLRASLSLVHWGWGLALPVLLGLHLVQAQRARRPA